MENRLSSHLIIILNDLLDGKALTSIDAIASNRNQYFRTIKNKGIWFGSITHIDPLIASRNWMQKPP